MTANPDITNTNPPDGILRKFTRELAVALNDHELQAYGKMLADKCKEEELAEERKKQVVAEHSNRIKVIRNEIKRIADARAKGEELRPVICGERLRGNVIEIVRLDRGEVVDTRPADLADLQTTMPGMGSPAIPDGFDEGPRGQQLGSLADKPLEGEGEALEDEPDGEPHAEDAGEMVTSSAGDGVYVGDTEDHDEETREQYDGDVPADEEGDAEPDEENVLRPNFGTPGRAPGESEDEMIDRKIAEREAMERDAPKPPSAKPDAKSKPTRERSAKANGKGKGKPKGRK